MIIMAKHVYSLGIDINCLGQLKLSGFIEL